MNEAKILKKWITICLFICYSAKKIGKQIFCIVYSAILFFSLNCLFIFNSAKNSEALVKLLFWQNYLPHIDYKKRQNIYRNLLI